MGKILEKCECKGKGFMEKNKQGRQRDERIRGIKTIEEESATTVKQNDIWVYF